MNLTEQILTYFIKRHAKKHLHQLHPIEKFDAHKAVAFLTISHTAMGDTLLSLPAIKSLKMSFPFAKVILLANIKIAPLLKTCDYIDEVIEYKNSLIGFFAAFKKIYSKRPYASFIFHGNSPMDVAFAFLSGSSYILKSSKPNSFSELICFSPDGQGHTIEARLQLLRAVHAKHVLPQMDLGHLNDAIKKTKAELFLREATQHGERFVGFQVGAADSYKMWPIERFCEVAKKLLEFDDKLFIVVTGNNHESVLAKKLVSECGERVINGCGIFKIDELPYLINRLSLLLTNDTGTMHLAIALKVPTLSLFSPTDSKSIGPYQDFELHQVIQKDGGYIQALQKKKRTDEAMRLIEVKEVYDACTKALS